MHNGNKKLFLYLIFLLSLSAGCSPFAYLTNTSADHPQGPIPLDCGSCHKSQFEEWSLSRHSVAFTDKVFQEEYQEAGDNDCLACHAPTSVRQKDVVGRSFNLTSGVDCISCHISDGKMHGPHRSSALFQPHPVEEKDEFYLQISLCAQCHGETATEYKKTTEGQTWPTCLGCHAATKKRTISQGSDFFSNILVSFEEPVNTRSHAISLDIQQTEQNRFSLTGIRFNEGTRQLTLAIVNPLPHNLPTGTFGQKSILLHIEFLRENEKIAEETLQVADETEPLLPGNNRQLAFRIPATVHKGDSILISLQRFGAPNDSRPPVVLLIKSFAFPLSDFK